MQFRKSRKNQQDKSKKRRITQSSGLLLVVCVLGAAFFGGLIVYKQLAGKQYRVGEHSFSNRDVNKLASVLQKNSSGSDTNQEARQRYVLLSALKTEADKQNIVYGQSEVDNFLEKTYAEKGSKEAYFDYMKTEYGWSKNDVYMHQTTEYLKSRLQDSLLSKRSYSTIYVRWDSMNVFYEEQKAAEIYKNRLDILNKHFVPMFEQKASNEAIAKMADIIDGMDHDQGNKIFMRQQGVPIYFKKWTPEQQIAIDPSLKHEEGEDLLEKLRGLKEKGDFVGPVKSNNGMLIIVRLDEAKGGEYVDWEQLAAEYAERSGIQIPDTSSGDQITYRSHATDRQRS